MDKGRMLVDFHNEIRMQTGGLVTSAQELTEVVVAEYRKALEERQRATSG